jgi:HK97 family phage major capsid protein
MDLQQMKDAYASKVAEVVALRDAAKSRDLTDRDYDRAEKAYAEANDLQNKIKVAEQRKAISDKFANIKGPVGSEYGEDTYTGRKGVGPLQFKESELAELHHAALSGNFMRKTITSDDSPMSTVPGYSRNVLPLLRDKARISDLIPSQQTSRPSEYYFRALTGATAAAPVAEGADKPESSPTYESVQVNVVKLAHYTRANDEVISDFAGFMDMISQELIAGPHRRRERPGPQR